MTEEKVMPCKWCGASTWHIGTGCCDRCWELQHRIQGDPGLATKILASVTGVISTSKEFADVRAFHQKFELLCFDTPGHLTLGKLKERIEFMQEELNEFMDASGFDRVGYWEIEADEGAKQDLAKQADALIDLVYVAMGTAVMMGLPWDAMWDDVQRANMAKVRGVTKRGHAVDVTKPPGWKGPQGEVILHSHGYNPVEEYRDDTQRQ